MTANMFLVMPKKKKKDFGHDQDHDYICVFIFCYFSLKNIYFRINDKNILTFKTVYLLSFHFKIICLLRPPSLTRAQPTQNFDCCLVRPNVKIGHRLVRQNR